MPAFTYVHLKWFTFRINPIYTRDDQMVLEGASRWSWHVFQIIRRA